MIFCYDLVTDGHTQLLVFDIHALKIANAHVIGYIVNSVCFEYMCE